MDLEIGGRWGDADDRRRLRGGLLDGKSLALGRGSLHRFGLLLYLGSVPGQVVEVALPVLELGTVCIAELLPMVFTRIRVLLLETAVHRTQLLLLSGCACGLHFLALTRLLFLRWFFSLAAGGLLLPPL